MRTPTGVPEISVFISSPSDVIAEREVVKQLIREINADPAWQSRCVIKPLAYEDAVPTQLGRPAQRIVDSFMRKSSDADIVVCILCNRLGTPVLDEGAGKEYLSGTHYELETAYSAFREGDKGIPRIMLFLGSRDCPDDAPDDVHAQYTEARRFKKSVTSGNRYEGLYFPYRDLNNFENLARLQLKQHLDQFLAGDADPAEQPAISTGSAPGIRAYLGQLAESYRWLSLQGIRDAGSLRIELEKVYVALKAEPESEYDLQQASRLHLVEVREEAAADSTDVIDSAQLEELDALNIRRTYRPAREEAKRSLVTDVRTLGDAFRLHRRLVILGGPGSGKTTLGRWLALQLASAGLRALDAGAQRRVMVPLSQIDPDIQAAGSEIVDLGPARLPIFLRLAHYARELAERDRKLQPSLPLIDYLGHDPDSCGLSDGLSAEARHALFSAHLQRGEAVVVLDGLDELSEANRRSVVLKIQDFMENHIPVVGPDEAQGQPWQDGGNQVIVTSRYVGYKFAPVQANCAHFGIQPMRRPAVERFSHTWTDAVNAVLTTEGHSGVQADRLIAEIYSPAKPRIRELATNPLLITILATVYWRDGKLPDQRAGVYDRVVESLLEIWLKREECRHLTREELLAALEPLAADMQENASGNGLVSLDRIGELVEGPLAHMSGMDPNDRRFRPRLDALLSTIRKHVGLLAEQSAGNYAFFHRTFQEFLAARHLLAERAKVAEKIGDRMDDPIWREPLLLALGFVMIDPKWGPEARSRLLADVLALDTPGALMPRATILMATALPELRNAPSAIVEEIAMRLLISYAISLEQVQARGLSEQIEQIFVRLRQGPQADTVARLIAEAIRRPANNRELAFAAATIANRIDWFTTELVEALLLATGRDRADLDWPIHRALSTALGQRPCEPSWLSSVSIPTAARLMSSHLPMRKLLATAPDLISLVREDTDWLCLLAALYGGFETSRSLEDIQREQQQRVQAAETAAAPVAAPAEPEDPAPPSPAGPVEFCPHFIVRELADPDLRRLIQRQLVARKPARELVPALLRRWESGGDVEGAAEALVGLAALGEDVLPLLRTSLAQVEREPAAQAALASFARLRAQLRDPLLRTTEAALRTLPEQAGEQHQLDLLRIALTARIDGGGAPLPVSADIFEHNYVAALTPEVKSALGAEYWAYLLSGARGADGGIGDLSVAPLSVQVTWSPDMLLHAWAAIPEAVNHAAARHLSWPMPILAARVGTPVERYLAMLESMATVPEAYHSIAGYVLAQCQRLLNDEPALVWETLAVCWRNGAEFIRSYRKFRDVGADRSEVLDYLDAKLLAHLASSDTADESGPAHAWMEVFEQTPTIADPYLRFRAQWQLLWALTVEGEVGGLDILGLLQQIPDPNDRLRSFEWILMTIPRAEIGLVDHLGLIDPLIRIVSGISDPENRARAQCRLALFDSNHLEALLFNAVESTRMIDDPVRKAATIGEIRDVWGRMPGMAEDLDALALTIPDAWARDKALGRSSRLVQVYRYQYPAAPLAWRLPSGAATSGRAFRQGRQAGSLPWALLYLSTAAAEAEALGSSPAGDAALWDRLLDDDPTPAVAALTASGLEEGVPVTARAGSILDRVVQTEKAGILDPLWAHLASPDPGAMGTIARWSSRPGSVGQWSALVQAESGRLTPEVVGRVIDLLATSTDLLRLRAGLALHGPTPSPQNLKRRWVVRRVGAEALDLLAHQATQLSNPPSVQTTLDWVQGDIYHDDPKAIETWLAQAASGGDSSGARWILGSLQRASDDAIPPLIAALGSSPPDLQHSLLSGLARLVYCSEHSKFSGQNIHLAVASVPAEIRAAVFVLPDGVTSLLDITKEAVEATQSGASVQHARALLESRCTWLDDASTTDQTTCLAQLRAIGSQFYTQVGHRNSYWTSTDKAAEPLAKDPRILELLLNLLANTDVQDDSSRFAHHLLTATEAIARFAPEAFAATASPQFWEPILTEWAQYGKHWVSRMAALRLLGRLRSVTGRVARGLRVAMDDVSFVQQAAYESVTAFRRIDGDILPDLLSLIDGRSAGTAAATTRLLVSTAKTNIAPADRRRILRSLQGAVARPGMARPVHLMNEHDGSMSIRFVDNLDRIIYRAIFEISGW